MHHKYSYENICKKGQIYDKQPKNENAYARYKEI